MKVIRSLIICGLFLSLVFLGSSYARRAKSIYDLFEKNPLLKVYISDIKNSSGDRKLDLRKIKREVENGFSRRKSHRFMVMATDREADIVIDIDVVEYYFTLTDPVDMVIGIIGIAADAAKTDHYARLQANCTVTDTTNNRVVWEEKVLSTKNHSTMTKEESYDIMYEEFAKSFLRRLMKRPTRR